MDVYNSISFYFGKNILLYLWFSSSKSFNLSLKFYIKLKLPFELAINSSISLVLRLKLTSNSSITVYNLFISIYSFDLLVTFSSFNYFVNLSFSSTKITIYSLKLETYLVLFVTYFNAVGSAYKLQ